MEIKINKLSIIILSYNEEKTLQTIVDKVIKLKLINNIKKEIIIVDDYSSDKSKEIIKNIGLKHKEIITIFLNKNFGRGNTIRTGLKVASGDFVIAQDSDLEYEPNDINLLLKKAINDNLDIVYGSRNIYKNKYSSKFFYLGGKFITFLTNIVYKQKLTDEATGYRLVKTSLFNSLNLTSNGFDFSIEFTAKVSNLGYKIKEVPISYKSRSFKEGKKITVWDGIITVFKIFKYF